MRSFVYFDVLACGLFPALLGFLAVPSIWLYAHTGLFSPDEMKELTSFIGPAVALQIGILAYSIGAATPHHRTNLADLMTYLRRFAGLIIWVELVMIGVHMALLLLCQALHLNGNVVLTMLALGLGWLMLYSAAVRTFLRPPLPEPRREIERGQDLEDANDVEAKARLDG